MNLGYQIEKQNQSLGLQAVYKWHLQIFVVLRTSKLLEVHLIPVYVQNHSGFNFSLKRNPTLEGDIKIL